MICPYEENLGCPYVDTAFMDKTTTCRECEHYHSGVRPVNMYKKKSTKEEQMEDWNNFMMGL